VPAGHHLQDLIHLVQDCPASELLRRAIFGTTSSILDLWSRPLGVARLLGLHGVSPCPYPLEGAGSTTTTIRITQFNRYSSNIDFHTSSPVLLIYCASYFALCDIIINAWKTNKFDLILFHCWAILITNGSRFCSMAPPLNTNNKIAVYTN